MSLERLVIATRRSPLALWQANHVKERLAALRPGLRVELLPLSTRGDELIDQRLDQAGGKGLFVKELETAMADARADLAVHSMKDVPAELPPGFVLAAITRREDPRDAFLSNKYSRLSDMPGGAVLGTSSLRRAAQVLERHARLEVRLLRGNVETRIAKLDRGEYDAIVLAVAGLARLGLAGRIRARLEPEESLPAPGQGALGIECRAHDTKVLDFISLLGDSETTMCVRAERAVSRALGGSCALPLAAFATKGSQLRLRALVASADGRRILRAEQAGSDPEALGAAIATELLRQGAGALLKT
jgi:hydroxymethylbilane synthase